MRLDFSGLLDVAARRGELAKEWTSDTAAQVLLAVLSGLLNEWLQETSASTL